MTHKKAYRKIIEWLAGYGVKPYDVEVYLYLLRSGRKTAREIIQDIKVPYGRIYEVLKRLCSKGYIVEYPGRPKTYVASPPHILMETLIREGEEKLRRLYEQADWIEQELVKIAYGHETRNIIATLSSSSEITTTSSKQISYSRFSIIISVDYLRALQLKMEFNGGIIWSSYLKNFRQTLKRGVDIKILISTYDIMRETETQLKVKNIIHELFGPIIQEFEGKNLEFRYNRVLFTPINIYDDNNILLKIRDPVRTGFYIGGVLINDLKLAKLMKNKFDTLWKGSESLY